eukprot:TRINITY_DN15106_c0_g1_i1.p1 TRINITY_DN15106_c0_g1~~TRINITY_DN15106_c0_g1_i1.p1  ORF type:complete len:718 (+),score=91.72 TRINITY_DN15106_c0_g1_i1:123-2276(+)
MSNVITGLACPVGAELRRLVELLSAREANIPSEQAPLLAAAEYLLMCVAETCPDCAELTKAAETSVPIEPCDDDGPALHDLAAIEKHVSREKSEDVNALSLSAGGDSNSEMLAQVLNSDEEHADNSSLAEEVAGELAPERPRLPRHSTSSDFALTDAEIMARALPRRSVTASLSLGSGFQWLHHHPSHMLRPTLRHSPRGNRKLQLMVRSARRKVQHAAAHSSGWSGGLVFSPDSPWRLCWDCIAACLIVVAFLITSVEVGFDLQPREGYGFHYLLAVSIDVFFLIDILLNFNTACYTENGFLLFERRQVVCHYLKTWFPIDLLASFPYRLVLDSASGASGPKMLRLLRVTKVFRLFAALRMLKLHKYLGLLFDVLPKSFAHVAAISKLLFKMLAYCHVFACLWAAAAVYADSSSHTWLDEQNLKGADVLTKYMTAAYFALATSTTVGYGDVTPCTLQEQACACVIMVLAIGSFGQLLSGINKLVHDEHEVSGKMHHRVHAADSFMRRIRVPLMLRRRVRRCVQHVSAVEAQREADACILGMISGPLRTELIASLICKILWDSRFFSGAATDVLHDACAAAAYITKEPGDLVVERGSLPTGLWTIATGRIQLLAKGTREPLCSDNSDGVLQEGQSWGEQHLLVSPTARKHKSPCSAECVTHCGFVHISIDDFATIFEKHPDFRDDVQRMIQEKYAWAGNVVCAHCNSGGHAAFDCDT